MNRTDAQAAITGHLRKSTRRTRRDGTTAQVVMGVLGEYAEAVASEFLDDKGRLQSENIALRERLNLARRALTEDGYFTPEEVGDDIAPRIVERLAGLARARDDYANRLKRTDRAYADVCAERDRLREQLAAVTRPGLTLPAECCCQYVVMPDGSFSRTAVGVGCPADHTGILTVTTAAASLPPAPAADVPAPAATRAPQPRTRAAEGSSKGTGRPSRQRGAQRAGTETEGFSE